MEFGSHIQWVVSDPLADLKAKRQALLSEGRHVIDLSMINPDMPPPRLMLDRLMEASMKGDNHRYAVSRGVRKLREAFSSKYRNKFGVELDPESEVCVTFGTKDALADVLQVVAAPGTKVLIAAPTYPAHLSAIHVAHLLPETFNLGSEEVMLAQLADGLKRGAKVVLLNFPNNPTGQSVSPAFWAEAIGLAKKSGAIIVNDFVYGEMGFGEKAPPSVLSVAGAREVSVEIYSLSKAYGVPGWRVGALLGNREIVQMTAHLKSQIDYGLFLPIQYAASAALAAKEDLTKFAVANYRSRCKLLANSLSGKGFTVSMPEAGASVWAKLPDRIGAGEGYPGALLEQHGILVMPGALFGSDFSKYVRIAAVAPEERLREVSARMGEIQ